MELREQKLTSTVELPYDGGISKLAEAYKERVALDPEGLQVSFGGCLPLGNYYNGIRLGVYTRAICAACPSTHFVMKRWQEDPNFQEKHGAEYRLSEDGQVLTLGRRGRAEAILSLRETALFSGVENFEKKATFYMGA